MRRYPIRWGAWLMTQRHREDNVGMFARCWHQDVSNRHKNIRTIDSLLFSCRLQGMSFDLIQASREAWHEYRQAIRRASLYRVDPGE